MKNKKGLALPIILGIVVLALILLAVGGYFGYKYFASGNNLNSNPEEDSSLSGNLIQKSFLDMLASGDSLKCSFMSTTPEGDKITQIVYFANNRFRMDSEVKLDYGQTLITSIIGDKDWLYFWQMPMGTGWKISVAEYENQEKSSGLDFQEEYPFSCSEWELDEKTFALPVGLLFQIKQNHLRELLQLLVHFVIECLV